MWHPMDLEVACKVIFRPTSSGGACRGVRRPAGCADWSGILHVCCCVSAWLNMHGRGRHFLRTNPLPSAENSCRCPAQCELTVPHRPSSSAGLLSSIQGGGGGGGLLLGFAPAPLLLCSKELEICCRFIILRCVFPLLWVFWGFRVLDLLKILEIIPDLLRVESIPLRSPARVLFSAQLGCEWSVNNVHEGFSQMSAEFLLNFTGFLSFLTSLWGAKSCRLCFKHFF